MREKKRRKYVRKCGINQILTSCAVGLFGLLLLYLTGIFNVKSVEMLKQVAYNNFFLLFGSLIFLGVCIYGIFYTIFDCFIPEKRQVLYLTEDENSKVYFVNKKGKKFYFPITKSMEVGNHYNVLTIGGFIIDVYDKTIADWEPVVEKVDEVEVIEKVEKELEKNAKVKKGRSIFVYVIVIVSYLFMLCIFLWIFFNVEGFKSKLIFLPFVLAVVSAFGMNLTQLIEDKYLVNIFEKIYAVVFASLMFGMLIYYDINCIKEGYSMYVYFTIPFFVAGFYLLYKKFLKKSKKED